MTGRFDIATISYFSSRLAYFTTCTRSSSSRMLVKLCQEIRLIPFPRIIDSGNYVRVSMNVSKKGALVTARIRPPLIPLRWGQTGYMHIMTHTILLTLDIKFSTNIDTDAQTTLHRTPVLSRKFSRGLQAQLLSLINSPPIFNPHYFWRRVASRIATKLYCLAFNDCLIRWF